MFTGRDGIRNAIIVIYMLGNAVTFNALIKAERAAIVGDASWALIILKSLALSLIWPIFWLYVILT